MAAFAAELQLSCCRGQLASTWACSSSSSSSSEKSWRDCSAVGFGSRSSSAHGLRRRSLEEPNGLVWASAGRLLPLTQSQRRGWRDRVLDGKRRGGERGFRMRKSVTVNLATGQLDSPKPSFVAMELITGEAHLDQVLSEAMERNQPVVIDWLAAWCRKCIYLKPKLEKLAAEYYPDIKFYYVDVNNVPQALVKRAEVNKMPTIQLWKDGKMKGEVIGGHQVWLVMEEVREMINLKK